MQNNTQAEKRKRWTEYEIVDYVASLREQQKEEPAPLVLRSKMNDLVGELYQDGYTCLEISKLLSMGKCTVYRVLKRKNIFKKQDRSIDKEVEESVVCMYRQGQEAKEISELLDITIPSIRWILKKNKVPSHRTRVFVKKEKPDEKVLEKAVQMYQKGIPYQDIKIKLGINNSHLYNTIRKSGVPLRGGCRVKTKQRIAAEEEAIRLYRDTDTYVRKIEEKTGIACRTLTRLLKARNIPFRNNLKR
ncbi:IS630 transposase-related protein [Dysgonomonas sp. 25]|uniref:IS630 transposase-related protein n=1 Tax=Dysgonomonas sp. 25 TaxID=2302933 RepID=UPI0013D7D5F1|nr:IS630 transposase-related protein [Dysgonomonas sp. 25]